MSQTAITSAPPLPAAMPTPKPKTKSLPRQALEYLADLRITVALFAFSLLLVFWGTVAQVDSGVWTVVQKYFRSGFVMVPLRVILFNTIEPNSIAIPFPGGWFIGTVMLVNLLAAHAVRFKATWNRAGILLIHAGIIVMMFGELITGLYAVEGQMFLKIGESGNTVIHSGKSELAILRTLDDVKQDEVITVPSSLLMKSGAIVDDPKAPFKIEAVQFMVNSGLFDIPKNGRATKGFGLAHLAKDQPEVSGVDPEQRIDYPSVYLKLSTHDGQDLGTWLFSAWLSDPQWIDIAGKRYQVMLRFKHTTRPFTFHLNNFKHDKFPGTETPKDFHSFVHVSDKELGERDVEIFMNAPFYFRGETFYQSSWTTDPITRKADGTVLQVVRNPGWLLPYISCGIVGFGMLLHFGVTLYRFVNRRIIR
jgi:hypothetical protein